MPQSASEFPHLSREGGVLIHCLGLVELVELGLRAMGIPACADHVQVVVKGAVQRDYHRSLRVNLCLYPEVLVSLSCL